MIRITIWILDRIEGFLPLPDREELRQTEYGAAICRTQRKKMA